MDILFICIVIFILFMAAGYVGLGTRSDRRFRPTRRRRRAAALIIASCASVSLRLMTQPFLSSRRLGRSESLTRTSPGSVKAEGAVGSRALLAPRLTTTPMLPFERKASPYRRGRAMVVNGRISSFARLIDGTAPLRNAPVRVALQAQPSIAYPCAFRSQRLFRAGTPHAGTGRHARSSGSISVSSGLAIS
jgi:hypothetical protein